MAEVSLLPKRAEPSISTSPITIAARPIHNGARTIVDISVFLTLTDQTSGKDQPGRC